MADNMEEVREKIARYLTGKFIADPDDCPRNECLPEANYILNSITLKRERVCPECNGQGDITGVDLGYPSNLVAYHCETCKGTGKVEETITLADLIKEWEDA